MESGGQTTHVEHVSVMKDGLEIPQLLEAPTSQRKAMGEEGMEAIIGVLVCGSLSSYQRTIKPVGQNGCEGEDQQRW